MRGFSLIEVLLVIVIIGLLGYLTLPLGIGFYQTLVLNSSADQLIQTLRQAQTDAQAAKFDSSFGVRLNEQAYTFFSSEQPSYDLTYTLDQGLTLSGLTEVIFSKITGLPNLTGEIFLANKRESALIQINNQGTIDLKHSVEKNVTLNPNAPSQGNVCNIQNEANCF